MKHSTEPVLAQFMLSEAAEVLGLPGSRVKNWTRGMPLTLPLVVPAHGKGSRNMYSVRETQLLAVAAQMSTDGLNPAVIQAVLDELSKSDEIRCFALVRNRFSGQLAWNLDPRPHVEIISARIMADKSVSLSTLLHDSAAYYILDVGRIADAVDERVAGFLKHRNVKKHVPKRMFKFDKEQ